MRLLPAGRFNRDGRTLSLCLAALLGRGALRLQGAYGMPTLRARDEVYIDGNKIEIIQYDDSNNDSKGNNAVIAEGSSPFGDGSGGFPPEFEEEQDPDVLIIVYAIGSMLIIYLISCLLFFTIKCVLKIIESTKNNHRLSLRDPDDMDQDLEQANENGQYDPYARDSRSHNNTRHHGRKNNYNNNSNKNNNNSKVNNTKFKWSIFLDNENEIKDRLKRLTPEDQFYYRQGEEYIKQNPPFLIPSTQPSSLMASDNESNPNVADIIDPVLNEQTRHFIDEEGASAWEFQPDPNLPNDTIIIENKTEVTFLNYNYDASVTTNLPIPCINRVYYCEFKIFEWNTQNSNENETNEGKVTNQQQELISFGLSSSPYPYFRLPGRHHHSIAYDSNGARRFNDSFPLDEKLTALFPKCEKGDVIGIGYRTRSGTVFFTRNGKKLNEKTVGGHIRGWKFKYIYPIIGANIPCKIHVNFGTYGFVFIEANVKKWGYGKINGMKLPPPSYEEYGHDTLLNSGPDDHDMNDEIESDNEFSNEDFTFNPHAININSYQDIGLRDQTGRLLPPPPGFEYNSIPNSSNLNNEEITLSYLPENPPIYSSDNDNNIVSSYNSPPLQSLANKITSPFLNSRDCQRKNEHGSSQPSSMMNEDEEEDEDEEDEEAFNYGYSDNHDIITDDEEYEDMSNELQHMIEQEQDTSSDADGMSI